MPWKGEKDPYKIWLSEIILQQTRVEQGLDYYLRFVKKYPSIKKLANAKDDEVFKLWEGLGYYSRCKNLLATARTIARDHNAEFPKKYEDILALKGVGPYTAAAIASFAYNLPYAVVDGNVNRVLARFFGIKTPIDSAAGKKEFNELAGQVLDSSQPAFYNQAIMDFGATVCKPQLPLCFNCVLNKACTAFKKGFVTEVPVKEKKLVKKSRWFYYIVAENEGKVMVRKRTAKDIWQNLYEFILIETSKQEQPAEVLVSTAFKAEAEKKHALINISEPLVQQLTHQTIHAVFINIKMTKMPKAAEMELVGKEQLVTLAFPRLINRYIQEQFMINVPKI